MAYITRYTATGADNSWFASQHAAMFSSLPQNYILHINIRRPYMKKTRYIAQHLGKHTLEKCNINSQ